MYGKIKIEPFNTSQAVLDIINRFSINFIIFIEEDLCSCILVEVICGIGAQNQCCYPRPERSGHKPILR